VSRLKAAVLWSYLLSTGSMAITGVLTFVLAAILDPESFGVLALGVLWVGFGQMLLQHGPTMAIIQLEKVTDKQANAAFWTMIAGAITFGSLFALLVPAWADFNNLPALKPVSWALIFVTVLTSISVIPDALMRREMKFKPLAMRTLAGAASGGVAGVAGAMLGWGVWALVAQQLVAVSVYALTVWKVTPWRPNFPRPREIAHEMRSMRRQSLQTLSGALGVFLSSRMDVLLMGAFFGPFMIGIYRFALRLAEMVVDVTSRGLQQVSLPELAQYQSDRELLGRRLANLVHVAVVMSVPALAVLAAVAEPLVLLIGPQWELAARPLQLLCVVSAIGTVNSLLGPAMQAVQRASIPAILTWVSAGISAAGLGFAAWTTRGSGIYVQLTAVATAAVAVQAVMLVITATLAYRFVLRVSILPTLRAIVPSILAALAGFGTAWLVSAVTWPPLAELVVAGGAGGAVAFTVLVALDDRMRHQGLRILNRILRRTPPAAAPEIVTVASPVTSDAILSPTLPMPVVAVSASLPEQSSPTPAGSAARP
jgi:teichuronic acid exporter